ncbi:MAG: hypothetical protein A2X77_04335 [Gammaproteobacteria bacterium GWE2_42_36]|nr:MAG: hypothetical protein A2X77_04335 [Gammaproteobacteria bacterium GWE2_42_36]
MKINAKHVIAIMLVITLSVLTGVIFADVVEAPIQGVPAQSAPTQVATPDDFSDIKGLETISIPSSNFDDEGLNSLSNAQPPVSQKIVDPYAGQDITKTYPSQSAPFQNTNDPQTQTTSNYNQSDKQPNITAQSNDIKIRNSSFIGGIIEKYGIKQHSYFSLFIAMLGLGFGLTAAYVVLAIGIVIIALFFDYIYQIFLKRKIYITQKRDSLYKCFKGVRGIKRLCLALSCLWIILVISFCTFGYCDFSDYYLTMTYLGVSTQFLGQSIQIFIFASMPVFLNWLAYWILLGPNCQTRNQKSQLIAITAFVLLLTLTFYEGFGMVFILASVPIWLFGLVYWVYLGFKK